MLLSEVLRFYRWRRPPGAPSVIRGGNLQVVFSEGPISGLCMTIVYLTGELTPPCNEQSRTQAGGALWCLDPGEMVVNDLMSDDPAAHVEFCCECLKIFFRDRVAYPPSQ